MAQVGTYEIGLDTPIHMLTPRQLFEMQTEWLQEHTSEPKSESPGNDKWIVNSMADLAGILGTSQSTLYRMKADGLLDEAISQYGKWMCIDVNVIIDKFRLSNRRNLVKIAGRTKRGRSLTNNKV